MGHRPEYLLSRTYFRENPDGFSRYYKENLIFPDAKPNPAHLALAKLEEEGKVKAVITQNIDGLHQMAGSKEVIEVHGNLIDHYCQECGQTYSLDQVMTVPGLFKCESCSGVVRPDIVLYEEPLDEENFARAIDFIRKADVFIVGGSSLVVYPAAGLLDYYGGDKLILMNMESTQVDKRADYLVYGDIAENLGGIRT